MLGLRRGPAAGQGAHRHRIAPGYEPRSETLKLAEGAVKELEVRLKPAAVRPARAAPAARRRADGFRRKRRLASGNGVGRTAAGKLLDQRKSRLGGTGEPVSKATMYLFYCVTHGSIFIDTAADGTFVFKDIPKGPFSLLMCNKAGYQNVAYNPEGKPGQFPDFSLKDGEQRSGIVLRAKRACRISGRSAMKTGTYHKTLLPFMSLAWTKRDHGETYESQQTSVKQADGSYSIDGLADKPAYVMVINWQAAREGNADPPIYYPSTFSRSEAEWSLSTNRRLRTTSTSRGGKRADSRSREPSATRAEDRCPKRLSSCTIAICSSTSPPLTPTSKAATAFRAWAMAGSSSTWTPFTATGPHGQPARS